MEFVTKIEDTDSSCLPLDQHDHSNNSLTYLSTKNNVPVSDMLVPPVSQGNIIPTPFNPTIAIPMTFLSSHIPLLYNNNYGNTSGNLSPHQHAQPSVGDVNACQEPSSLPNEGQHAAGSSLVQLSTPMQDGTVSNTGTEAVLNDNLAYQRKRKAVDDISSVDKIGPSSSKRSSKRLSVICAGQIEGYYRSPSVILCSENSLQETQEEVPFTTSNVSKKTEKIDYDSSADKLLAVYISDQTIIPISNDSSKYADSGSTMDVDGQNGVTESGNKKVYQFGCYLCHYLAATQQEIMSHWAKCHLKDKPYFCNYCKMCFNSSYKAYHHIHECHQDKEKIITLISPVYKKHLLFNIDQHEGDDIENSVPAREVSGNKSAAGGVINGMTCDQCDFCGDHSQMTIHKTQKHKSIENPSPCNTHGNRHSKHALNTKTREMMKHTLLSSRSCTPEHVKLVSAIDSLNSEMVHPNIFELLGNDCREVSLKFGSPWSIMWDLGLPIKSEMHMCRKCDYSSKKYDSMFSHCLANHEWDINLLCHHCAENFTEKTKACAADGKSSISCPNCSSLVAVPFLDEHVVKQSQETHFGTVYICRVCHYNTKDRSGVSRHIKYSHTNYRPYRCAYCTYKSLEKTKVCNHQQTHHSSNAPRIRHNTKLANELKRSMAILWKITIFELANFFDDLDIFESKWSSVSKARRSNKVVESDIAQQRTKDLAGHMAMITTADTANCHTTLFIKDISTTSRGTFHCNLCKYETSQWSNCVFHVMKRHPGQSPSSHKTRGYSMKNVSCYRCLVCDYACFDRSSMKRHVNYKHISERPHSCPACNYRNVEKIKVTQHIKHNHYGMYKVLEPVTNYAMLTNISRHVENCYSWIEYQGDNQTQMNNEPKHSEEPNSLNGLEKTDTPTPQYIVANVHSQSGGLFKTLGTLGSENLNVDLNGCYKSEQLDVKHEFDVGNDQAEQIEQCDNDQDDISVKDEPIDSPHSGDHFESTLVAADLEGLYIKEEDCDSRDGVPSPIDEFQTETGYDNQDNNDITDLILLGDDTYDISNLPCANIATNNISSVPNKLSRHKRKAAETTRSTSNELSSYLSGSEDEYRDSESVDDSFDDEDYRPEEDIDSEEENIEWSKGLAESSDSDVNVEDDCEWDSPVRQLISSNIVQKCTKINKYVRVEKCISVKTKNYVEESTLQKYSSTCGNTHVHKLSPQMQKFSPQMQTLQKHAYTHVQKLGPKMQKSYLQMQKSNSQVQKSTELADLQSSYPRLKLQNSTQHRGKNPSEHRALSQCCFNVELASEMVDQNLTNIGSSTMSGVCRDVSQAPHKYNSKVPANKFKPQINKPVRYSRVEKCISAEVPAQIQPQRRKSSNLFDDPKLKMRPVVVIEHNLITDMYV